MHNIQQKNLPEILARIQYFQDSLSKLYGISIFICDSWGEDYTIPSGQTEFCGRKLNQSKEICKNFFKRMREEADKRKSLVISRCPFSAWVAVAPMECLLKPDAGRKTRYFLVLKQTEDTFWEQNSFSIDGLESFRESAELVSNCMDIIFSLMKQADLLPEPQTEIKRENFEKLTTREKEIARLVSNGMSNQEIAGQLIISEHTVKTHISNILKKLELNNRTKIAMYEMNSL